MIEKQEMSLTSCSLGIIKISECLRKEVLIRGNSYRKITTHSFRAYFFTRAVRAIGENYAHKMTGHGGYLLEYDRYDDKKKLELYLKLEPSLLVYESYNEDVADLRKQMKKQDDKIERLQQESELNRRINDLQRDMREASIYTSDGQKYDELNDTAEKIKSKLAILRQKE